jgi:hypothetical protein
LFPFSYFHSVSIFPRKSRKVSAPLSSLLGSTQNQIPSTHKNSSRNIWHMVFERTEPR